MALELIKLVKGSSAVSQVGSFGFFKLSADTGGGGGSDIVFDRVFGNNTPDVISAVSAVISANNMTSAQVAQTYGWNIGDTIDIPQTDGTTIQMQIIGINHDNKSDGSGKAGITLQTIKVFYGAYWHNSASCADGYSGSRCRSSVMGKFRTSLSAEWQNVIKSVDKTSSKAYSSTEVVTTSETLFPLSQIELFGTTDGAQNGNKEGTQYEYWVGKSETDRIKAYQTSGAKWWTRSMSTYGLKYTVYVTATGTTGRENPNESGIYYSFAFCV